MKPIISIIIPCYNQAHYLLEAIHSVLGQTFTNWEAIIVNDGSTDNTANVVDTFDDPRIRYMYQENRGLAGARNTGIRAAQGEIVALLDSDDLWEPEFLEKMTCHLEQYPQSAAAYCGFRYIDGGGQIVGKPSLKVVPPVDFYRVLSTEGNWLVPCAVIFRKQLVEAVGLFDEKLRAVEDTDLWLRLSAHHSFVGLPEILVRYRRHESNMTQDPEHMVNAIRLLTQKRQGLPTGDILLWSETKRLAYAKLYHYGTWSYLAAGNIPQSAAYFQQFFDIAPNMALGMAVWRTLARVHLPVEYRNDSTIPLNWEVAQRDIESLVDELERKAIHLEKQIPKIKGSALLALADEATRAGELKYAYRWLWYLAIHYPRVLLSRPYWGTLARSITHAKTYLF